MNLDRDILASAEVVVCFGVSNNDRDRVII